MNELIKTRAVGKHKKNCLARKNINNGFHRSAWGTIDDPFVLLIYRTRTEGPWFRMACNDPDCDAKLLVRFSGTETSFGLEDYLPRW
jgi:hypothetical protein